MKHSNHIQCVVRRIVVLILTSSVIIPGLLWADPVTPVAVAAAPPPAAPPPPQVLSVDLPALVDVTGTGDDITITTGGTINTASATDMTATAGTSGSANKTVTAKSPLKIKLTGSGKAKVTVAAPGNIAYTLGTLTVSGGGAVGVEITAPKKKVDMIKQEASFFPLFYLTVGSVTLNPYRIVNNGTGGYKIDTSSSETAVILQVDYADRWAWHTSNRTEGAEWRILPKYFIDLDTYDFQLRAGYTFGSDQTNASTIMGSGNLDMEFTLGKQIYRNATATSARSINLGVAVATVTDRQFSDSHTSVTLGGSYVTSFQNPILDQSTNRIYLLFGGGLANYELPRFLGSGTDIHTNSLGLPDFHRVWGGMMNAEVRYQLGAESYISAGARVFPSRRIAPWELWVGYSASFDQIKGVISKLYQ